jgi:hypothetical protein
VRIKLFIGKIHSPGVPAWTTGVTDVPQIVIAEALSVLNVSVPPQVALTSGAEAKMFGVVTFDGVNERLHGVALCAAS